MKNSPKSLVHFVCQWVGSVWSHSVLFGGLMMAVSTNSPTHAQAALPGGAQAFGNLSNFDVRYPASLPNDLEIVLYGSGIDPTDIKNTWNTDIPLNGVNLGWGQAVPQPITINNDPTSPAYGLDCLSLRYAGPPRPELVGKMVHAGVALKPWINPPAWEVWWTINGQRVLRPCDPKINWFWVTRTREWVICVENPTPSPIYVYGCRWFLPVVAAGTRLPFLNDLTTTMNPAQFGSQGWTFVDPVGSPTKCILPWCRIYIRVKLTTTKCYPIIFQIASRNGPLSESPRDTAGMLNDWNGDQGTMMIVTQRPVQQPDGDLNCDGVVGTPDFNIFRQNFGIPNEDN